MNLRILLSLTVLFACVVTAEEASVVATISQKEQGSRLVDITFKNQIDQEVTIIRPLDGSLWKWHFPYYDFTVSDSDGTSLRLGGRCGVSGLWADTEWPKDYLVPIAAQETATITILLPHAIPSDGDYEISFTYEWPAVDDQSKVLDSVFHGTIKAEPIRASIKKTL